MSLHNTSHSLADTLSVAQALTKKHGITRSADVTEFSRINLPVWIALRPNAKCLSQSAGKGLCKDSAHISALMEGIEVACSENINLDNATHLTIEASRNHKVACTDPTEHPLQPCIPTKQEIPWLETTCLKSGSRWLVPAGMLSLDFTLTGSSGEQPRQFRTTSNGLASGRTYTEACVSGLLEVIERHSVTLNNMLKGELKKIEIGHCCPPNLSRVLEEINKYDVSISVFDASAIPGIHAIEAFLWSPSGAVPPVHGFGCSLDLEVAILRAILEANQASTLLLSGSRDDLTKHTYLVTADAEKIANTYDRKTKSIQRLGNKDFMSINMTPQEELNTIIKRTSTYVDREILVYRYTPEDYPVSVCKVLIPTLEGYFNNGYRPQYAFNASMHKQELFGGLQLAAGGKI